MSEKPKRLSCEGGGLLSLKFAVGASGFEFLVAGLEDGVLGPGQAIGWGDVAERAVEAGGIIMIDELADDALGVFEGERGFGPDRLLLERAMEALQFAVALRVMGRREDVGRLPEA